MSQDSAWLWLDQKRAAGVAGSVVCLGHDVVRASTGARYLCVRVRGQGSEIVMMYDSRDAQKTTHDALAVHSARDAC